MYQRSCTHWVTIPVEREHVVAGGGCVEIVPDPELETKRSLHLRLPAGDGQAKRSREVVDNVFEWVQVRDRGDEVWAMQELGDRLTVSDINTAGDAELLEESKDFGGRLMRDRAGESIRQHAYPDRRLGGMAFPVLDGLDGWNVVVGEVLVVLRVVIVIVLFLLNLLVVLLVKPRELDHVNGSEFNASFVEFYNLGISVHRMLYAEMTMHLVTNRSQRPSWPSSWFSGTPQIFIKRLYALGPSGPMNLSSDVL